MTPKQILLYFSAAIGISLISVAALVFLAVFTTSYSIKEIPEGSTYDITVKVTYFNGDTAIRSFSYNECDTVKLALDNGDLNFYISHDLAHGGDDKEVPFSNVRSYDILKSEGYHPYVSEEAKESESYITVVFSGDELYDDVKEIPVGKATTSGPSGNAPKSKK